MLSICTFLRHQFIEIFSGSRANIKSFCQSPTFRVYRRTDFYTRTDFDTYPYGCDLLIFSRSYSSFKKIEKLITIMITMRRRRKSEGRRKSKIQKTEQISFIIFLHCPVTTAGRKHCLQRFRCWGYQMDCCHRICLSRYSSSKITDDDGIGHDRRFLGKRENRDGIDRLRNCLKTLSSHVTRTCLAEPRSLSELHDM
jgi:hypothetical protein